SVSSVSLSLPVDSHSSVPLWRGTGPHPVAATQATRSAPPPPAPPGCTHARPPPAPVRYSHAPPLPRPATPAGESAPPGRPVPMCPPPVPDPPIARPSPPVARPLPATPRRTRPHRGAAVR